MRSDWIISGVAHAAILVTALVSFAYSMPSVDTSQFMPVTVVTLDDVSKAPKGRQDAPKPKPDPKPLADKIDVPKPADQVADKVTEKPAIKTDTKPKEEQKPDPKPAEKPKAKTPEYKPDKIADLLKKDAAKQPPKTDDKPDKPAQNTPKFDANQVAHLLDHRAPQRQVASADTINNQASLGAANGAAAQLSQDEIDYIKARLASCWSPPPGVDVASKVKIALRVLLKRDGSLVQQPVVVEGTPSPLGPALAESAIRAVITCQPFDKLRPEHYEQWRDLTLDFDPAKLLGG